MPLKLPLPWREGIEGRGIQIVFDHPSPSQRLYEPAATPTLPRQGRGEID